MSSGDPNTGTVYSETVIHLAPADFVDEAPYQIAIIDLDNGERKTVRLADDRVSIGDRVVFSEFRKGVPVFKKI